MYTAQVNGDIERLPGDVVLVTDRFLLIKLFEPCEFPVSIQGSGVMRPLRIHRNQFVPNENHSISLNPLVTQIAEAVSEDSLQGCISHLESYGTRYTFYPQYDACADWADTMMESYGLDAELQTFFYQSDYMSNVVGEIRGTQFPDSIYLICGHLDSISDDPPVAPGADDNASGSSCVLEAARVMSPYHFRNTVRFVLFAAEEQWMIGSEYYVHKAFQQGENILGAVNVDMLLYAPSNTDSVYIPYNDHSQDIADLAGDIFEEYAPGIYPRVVYDPGAPSDHASFWQYGYPAIEIAEASCDEIWGGYNPNYHSATDVLANYLPSYPYGTQMSRAAIALIATLADPVGSSVEEVSGGNLFRAGANPSSGSITVIGSMNREQVAYIVYNVLGREVSRGVLSGDGEYQIHLQSLPGGLYTLVFPWLDDQPPLRYILLN